MSDRSFDIVIVGAGMVGAALAAALSHTPLRIAIVEGATPATLNKDTMDLRVSAISRASQRLLETLGVWQSLCDHATPYRYMRVWDSGGYGSTTFAAAELGETDLGHIIENQRIQLALWNALAQQTNLTRCCPALVESFTPGRAQIEVRLADRTRLYARLLVGADGSHSRVRGLAGISTTGWSYGQKTIVGNVRTARDHRYTAWQRFLSTGPVAFLPLHDGSCSIAWHTQADEADRLMALGDGEFCAELTKATGQVLGVVESIGDRGCFPLRRQHAVNYHRGRVVLVGDAAHTIHPLAGQGVNLGFLDASVLAGLLGRAAQQGDDPAHPTVLARYERRRRPHNLAVMTLMDFFTGVFGVEATPLRWVRNLGLTLADQAGPLKRRAIRYATGMEASPIR